jgi:hypothetical protein
MDPQVATSFIPKQTLTVERDRGSIGLFMLISLFIFVVSIIAAGAVVAYTQVLNKNLADAKKQLDIQKGAFDPSTIQDLLRLDSRIQQGKQLLGKHLAPSAIFDLLSQNTLQNVQFTSLDYKDDDKGVSLTMDGIADSFSTLALQSDAFGKSASLKDVIFSKIAIDVLGHVAFTLSATVDPGLISYSKQVAGGGGFSASTTEQTAAVSSAPVPAPTTPAAPTTVTPKAPATVTPKAPTTVIPKAPTGTPPTPPAPVLPPNPPTY